MSMEGVIVTLAIAAAAAYLIRRTWRRLKGKAGGCGHSGSSAKKKVELTIGGARIQK